MKIMTLPSIGIFIEQLFHISADETRILDFSYFYNSDHISLVHWRIPTDSSDVQFRQISRQEITVSLYGLELSEFYILPGKTSGWFVSTDGEMEKIFWDRPGGELADMQSSHKTNPDVLNFVSNDVTRLGVITSKYGQHAIEVQILDITTTGRLLRLLRLALPPPATNEYLIRKKNIQFSPDLSVLFTASGIFHIGHDDERVASESISAQHLIPWSQDSWRWDISPCNNYAMCMSTNDGGFYLGSQCRLLRINLGSRSVECIDTPFLEGAAIFSSAFHPSLSLMIATHNHDSHYSVAELRISIFDLDLNIITMQFPYFSHGKIPSIGFSDCGTFICNLSWFQGVRFICEVEAMPTVPVRVFQRAGMVQSEGAIVYKSAVYDFFQDPVKTSLTVKLSKLPSRGTGRSKQISIKDLCPFSFYSKGAEKIYLLGGSETGRMRVLFLPSKTHPRVEIRTLQFTFAELSTRLHRLWEEKFGVWEKTGIEKELSNDRISVNGDSNKTFDNEISNDELSNDELSNDELSNDELSDQDDLD